MRSFGQIALGALVAVCISGAGAGVGGPQINAHQQEIAARQLERVGANIDLLGTKVVEASELAIRSLLRIAD